MNESQDLVKILQLVSHPEGGFYRETYRSTETMLVSGNTRNVSTAIYFLLEKENKSRFHRIRSDELWFFHKGDPLEIVYIAEGVLHTIVLGSKGSLQAVIPANTWFAAKINGDAEGYALVSC